MNTKIVYTLADLSRIANSLHRFGTIKTLTKKGATAWVQAASGLFETPELPVINRPLGATVGEPCLLIAPQGKPEQGILVGLGIDTKLIEQITDTNKRLTVLEQS
ncbi:hypothetical protein [uncultured Thiothrix sp.]|uniref:hypothetical protein n=1 Tax=uncultured Thiothrix sp. TaxID=223185 RepID=UPI00262089F9|nr:hypothetical protein [uncultured Thiothrix sp.]